MSWKQMEFPMLLCPGIVLKVPPAAKSAVELWIWVKEPFVAESLQSLFDYCYQDEHPAVVLEVRPKPS